MEITGTDGYRPTSAQVLRRAAYRHCTRPSVACRSANMGFRPCRTLFITARPPFLASALQLLLQMPPASPFTASPFDLVINPGQRANSPVRPWLHPTFGRARLRTKTQVQTRRNLKPKNGIKNKMERRPIAVEATGSTANQARRSRCLPGLRWPSPAI